MANKYWLTLDEFIERKRKKKKSSKKTDYLSKGVPGEGKLVHPERVEEFPIKY